MRHISNVLTYPLFNIIDLREIIQIQAATEKKIVWRYMEENARDWKKSREGIRFSKTWKRIRAEIPGFLWGNTVLYVVNVAKTDDMSQMFPTCVLKVATPFFLAADRCPDEYKDAQACKQK